MGICSPLFYFIHGKNDKTDVEEDAIGRDEAGTAAYQDKQKGTSALPAQKEEGLYEYEPAEALTSANDHKTQI